jgi:hypothetical protein
MEVAGRIVVERCVCGFVLCEGAEGSYSGKMEGKTERVELGNSLFPSLFLLATNCSLFIRVR